MIDEGRWCFGKNDNPRWIIDSPGNICSNREPKMPELSSYLLCPRDREACARQDVFLYNINDDYNLEIPKIRSGELCWFSIKNLSPDVSGVHIYNFTFNDEIVKVQVFQTLLL
jgi:hypothetical protein